MEQLILKICYETLTSISIAFIAVIIPFAGAYWIFKKTIKTGAELKIFEVGRDISEILHEATDIRSPLGGIAYSYIDQNLHKIDEPNRNMAIHKLLKKLLFTFPKPGKEPEFDETEKANIAIAIASDRFEDLVPQGINWSGKGETYSSYGEDITIEDKFFPFGTKLYRKWVKQFSYLYNDLWMCINEIKRKDTLEIFSKNRNFFDENYLSNWVNGVEKTTHELRNQHSKLISQIQIIDNIIEEKQFIINLLFCIVYIFLIGIVGYYVPRILFELKLLTIGNILSLSVGVFSLFSLVIYRLLFFSNHPSMVREQRPAAPVMELSDPVFLA